MVMKPFRIPHLGQETAPPTHHMPETFRKPRRRARQLAAGWSILRKPARPILRWSAVLAGVTALTVGLGYAFAAKPPALQTEGDLIKWVDFSVTATAMKDAMAVDIASHENGEAQLDWIELLALLGTRYGGRFSKYKAADLRRIAEKLQVGDTAESLMQGNRYYPYYRDAYRAALGGLVGEYEVETPQGWQRRYGLKAFVPIAKGFDFQHYDDFGAGRSYGYKRRHLGHDLMALVGTPIVAVESGRVEALGWNQYGGWRVGLRSFDGKRYYYFAHMRQNRPYAEGLVEGQVVMAGDVIGYVGRTGYSAQENTNGITESHLHVGLQLIFDESQKDSDAEIWIDTYQIIKFLTQNRSATLRNAETKEHTRAEGWRETVPSAPSPPFPHLPSA